MEQKKFSTNIEEYAYLKQWLSHEFSDESEAQVKRARMEQIKKVIGTPSDRDLLVFNRELGRSRSATLQHIVREMCSIPQRILLDQEVYRRMEGRKTADFKFLLIKPISDDVITKASQIAASSVANSLNLKKEGAPTAEDIARKTKSEILTLLRTNSPQAMVAEILAGAEGGVVTQDHIVSTCQKYYPEFPVDPTT